MSSTTTTTIPTVPSDNSADIELKGPEEEIEIEIDEEEETTTTTTTASTAPTATPVTLIEEAILALPELAESIVETSCVYCSEVRTALIKASEDIIMCYKFTHIPTGTPLFVGNGFFTQQSRLFILWVFQYTDSKTQLAQTYKKIQQSVHASFHGDEKNMMVTLRAELSYPSTNVTNELAADFLMILQKSYPDIRVEKVKPTALEAAAKKACLERKELESKLLLTKHVEEFENFKHSLAQSLPITIPEETFFDGAGLLSQSWGNDEETSPTSATLISDSSTSTTPSAALSSLPATIVNGLQLFQDSKLKQQIAIVLQEICKQFQPVAGYVENLSHIKMKDTCFAITDLEYAFDHYIYKILKKGRVMMQIVPLHVQTEDQIWLRLLVDNQLIEIDRDSFGLFIECKLSQQLQVFTINRFFPLFKTTNKRKQEVVNTAIKQFMDAVDTKLQAFFATTTFVSSQTLPSFTLPVQPSSSSESTSIPTNPEPEPLVVATSSPNETSAPSAKVSDPTVPLSISDSVGLTLPNANNATPIDTTTTSSSQVLTPNSLTSPLPLPVPISISPVNPVTLPIHLPATLPIPVNPVTLPLPLPAPLPLPTPVTLPLPLPSPLPTPVIPVTLPLPTIPLPVPLPNPLPHGPPSQIHPQQRGADIDLSMIQEMPITPEMQQQSLSDVLPISSIGHMASARLSSTILKRNNNRGNKRRAARTSLFKGNTAGSGKKDTLF